ncbi:Hypothetical predicted protein, partial [Pelobates cultripes]
ELQRIPRNASRKSSSDSGRNSTSAYRKAWTRQQNKTHASEQGHRQQGVKRIPLDAAKTHLSTPTLPHPPGLKVTRAKAQKHLPQRWRYKRHKRQKTTRPPGSPTRGGNLDSSSHRVRGTVMQACSPALGCSAEALYNPSADTIGFPAEGVG